MRNLTCSKCGVAITKASASGKCYICSQHKKPYQRIYNKVRAASKIKNIPCMAYEEFLLFTTAKACHYCGSLLEWIEFGKKGTKYNLDKIFPENGYIIENCVPCCWMCNEARGIRFSYVEFCKLKEGLKLISEGRKNENCS